MNLRDISDHWVALHETLGLGSPIADELAYEQALGTVADRITQIVSENGGASVAGIGSPRINFSFRWTQAS